MPNYDYVCQSCNHEFEVFQQMTAAPLKKCPECGGPVKRKIGTGAGLIFKGSGFYITDYKKNKTSASPQSATPQSASPQSAPPQSASSPKKEKIKSNKKDTKSGNSKK